MLPNSTCLSADKDFNLNRSFDNKIRKTKHYSPQHSKTRHLDNCENIFFLGINLTELFPKGKEYSCFPQWLSGKESTCNAEDSDSIPGLGRSPGGGNGNSLQYACRESSIVRGAWWATVHGVTKSWTQLNKSTKSTLSKELDKRLELDKKPVKVV